jgi:hypothetical protein
MNDFHHPLMTQMTQISKIIRAIRVISGYKLKLLNKFLRVPQRRFRHLRPAQHAGEFVGALSFAETFRQPQERGDGIGEQTSWRDGTRREQRLRQPSTAARRTRQRRTPLEVAQLPQSAVAVHVGESCAFSGFSC